MKAVMVGAGMGTSLRPLTNSRPECLVDMAGKPTPQHQLESLAKAGVDRELAVGNGASELISAISRR